jgi:GTP cyclohydrolase I
MIESQPLRLVRSGLDIEEVERAAEQLLQTLGVDTDAPGIVDTPRRMAQAYIELLTPRPFAPTTFSNDGHYDELILVRDIAFTSLCEHHMLPFVGVAHVGYLPGDRLLGLSKLARVVEHFARGMQLQERLTVEIADWLQHTLSPRGVGVVIEAEHMCMSMRGVRAPGTRTATSRLTGALRDDSGARAEFLARCAVTP